MSTAPYLDLARDLQLLLLHEYLRVRTVIVVQSRRVPPPGSSPHFMEEAAKYFCFSERLGILDCWRCHFALHGTWSAAVLLSFAFMLMRYEHMEGSPITPVPSLTRTLTTYLALPELQKALSLDSTLALC